MQISKILKSLRTENGLTQQELSERLKIGQATIACYENGQREPQLQILIAYADFFECSLDYLAGRTDDLGNIVSAGNTNNGNSLTDEEIILLKKYRNLNKLSRTKVNGYIDGITEK